MMYEITENSSVMWTHKHMSVLCFLKFVSLMISPEEAHGVNLRSNKFGNLLPQSL